MPSRESECGRVVDSDNSHRAGGRASTGDLKFGLRASYFGRGGIDDHTSGQIHFEALGIPIGNLCGATTFFFEQFFVVVVVKYDRRRHRIGTRTGLSSGQPFLVDDRVFKRFDPERFACPRRRRTHSDYSYHQRKNSSNGRRKLEKLDAHRLPLPFFFAGAYCFLACFSHAARLFFGFFSHAFSAFASFCARVNDFVAGVDTGGVRAGVRFPPPENVASVEGAPSTGAAPEAPRHASPGHGAGGAGGFWAAMPPSTRAS